MKLSRSFFGIYAFVVSLFLTSGFVLDEMWRHNLKEDINSYTGYSTLLGALEQYALNNPSSSREELFNDFSSRFNIPLQTSTLNEFVFEDPNDLEQVKEGDSVIATLGNELFITHRIGDEEQIIVIGPVKVPERPRIESMARVVMLGTVALIILFWLWPISRDLDRLKEAAIAIGKGNFKSRAGRPKSAMMGATVNTFDLMAARIERLVDAQKEFTNAISHELRTPLARSKFALQILEGIEEPSKQVKYQNQIRSDIHELEELINEMLAYSALDSDKPRMEMTQTSIAGIVQNQLRAHQGFSSSIEVEIKDGDFEVDCDSHFIERALSNYITNANKYGKDRIKIEAKHDNKYVTLTVHDNGNGVDEAFKEVAFDAFSRADTSRNKETGGFGLGLAIVMRVMEWHKGEAFIGDSPLGGAMFGLKWPIKSQSYYE